jgi:hypothetical protein
MMIVRYPALKASLFGLSVIILVGCGGGNLSSISSLALPGNPVISFPNGPDRVNTTIILSNPAGSVAGVDGRVLTVQTVTFSAAQDELTVDIDGNMGLRGSYHTLSVRSAKKDIKPFRTDALGIVDRTNIVSFRYRAESGAHPEHIGIIADDAPIQLTDGHRHSFDLNNSIAVSLAATRELHEEVTSLEREVAALRIEVLRKRSLGSASARHPST